MSRQLDFGFGPSAASPPAPRAPSETAAMPGPRPAPSRPTQSRAAPSRAEPSRAQPSEPVVRQPLPPLAPRSRPQLSPRLALEARIGAALRVPTRLVVTNNRRTMISSRQRGGGRIEVRLHQMFLDASDKTIEDLLCYLADGDRHARAAVREFIRNNRQHIERPARRVLLRTKGAVYDLGAMLDEVVHDYIPEGAEGVRITWGRRPSTKRRRQSIRLGTYTHDQQLIRIHPALDQTTVPRFFVAFVVFHEMLHHVVPGRASGDRMLYHPPEFRARERTHPDFARATAWETKNLDLLLSYGTRRPRSKR